MRIVKVEPLIIDLPLDQAVRTSFGEMTRRTNVLIRIEADSGEFGIGEIWNNFPSWGVHEKIATLKYGIHPLLLGEDPLEIGKIHHKLLRALSILGLQWGAVGPIYHSISGVDMALWDLAGKHLKQPVYKLLGGKLHDEIEVYASGLGPVLSDDLVMKHQAMGVTRFKLKVGEDMALNLRNLTRMREIIGPEDHLMIDANQAWDRRSAVKHLKRYQAFHLSWIEEPLRCDDLEGLKDIRQQTGIPIAAGENIYGSVQARKAMELQAVDIIQPDLSKNGGLTASRQIAELAGSYGVPYVPHFLGGAVCLAASIQFIAGIAGGALLELDANPNPFREKLFVEPLSVQGGKVKVSDRPGLGFELDQEFVDYYSVKINPL